MANDDVSIVIRAKDLASRVFQKVGKAIELNTQNVKRLARGLTVMAAAAAGAVAVMMRMISRGSELLSVQRAFNNIAGGEGVEALQKLRAATQGLVTDYELMKNANQAISLGAVDTIDGFSEMASLAQGLGRAFGITATEALGKFTVGLARMSKLRLDDLGITLDVAKANADYAKGLGVSVTALTEEQKAIAFRSAAMAEARRLVDNLGASEGNAANAVGRLTTALKNTVDKLSLMIAQAPGVTAFFEKFAEGAQNIATLFTGSAADIELAFTLLGQLAWNAFSYAFLAPFEKLFNWIEKAGFGGIFSGIADIFESSMTSAIDNIKAQLEVLGATAERVMPGMGGGGAGAGGGGGGGSAGVSIRRPRMAGAGVNVYGKAGGWLPSVFNRETIDRSIAARQNFKWFNQALEEQARAQENAARSSEYMATTVINTFAQMAASAVSNSRNMLATVVGGVASIAGAAVGIANPAAGAAIAAGGGFLSGILSKGPAPVRLEEYSATALSQMNEQLQPVNFTAILRMDGADERIIQQRLYKLTRQDASPRILVPIAGGGA